MIDLECDTATQALLANDLLSAVATAFDRQAFGIGLGNNVRFYAGCLVRVVFRNKPKRNYKRAIEPARLFQSQLTQLPT